MRIQARTSIQRVGTKRCRRIGVDMTKSELAKVCEAARKEYDTALALPRTEYRVDAKRVKTAALALFKATQAYEKGV